MSSCPVCHNLSDNCLVCGGTNKIKEARGCRVCPVCHNQSDHCMVCGGNASLQRKLNDDEEWDGLS